MKEYEITYHIDPQLEEGAREELNAKVDAVISDLGGSVHDASPANRKKLMYPIHKTYSVFSRTVHAQLDPAHMAECIRKLKKTEGVLRTMALQTAKRDRVSFEMLEEKKEAQKKEEKPEREQKKVTMKDVEKGIEEALSEEVK